jgi:cyclohexanone monooxygenase
MSKTFSAGIIGAGPGGLALGIFLKKAGFRDFTIFDREDGVGGTWRINTYPGLACDVKSHLYSYSFDLNANWSRLWSAQPEILEYFERCAQRYELLPHLKPATEVVSAEWDNDTDRWQLTTAAGDVHSFDIVVSAVGLFTQPTMPTLVEEEPFTGTVMHSARWDHSVDLEGVRVAVLGTGSTASQLLPELAKIAEKVYSIQRSPTWILPKPDRPYTDREKWTFARVPFAKRFYRTRLWLRSESNISVIENGSDKTQEFKAIALKVLESTVSDDQLRQTLTPEHPLGCKRLVFSSDFIPALTQPNVEVVSSPARSLRARSLVTEDGSELEVDVVVCATGYAAADYLGQIEVVGQGDTTLREKWRDGACAYLGMAVPDFPNFFMLYGPNTNVGSNSVIFMLEAQAHYIVRALKYMRRRRKSYVAVRPEAMADFIAKIDRWMDGTVWLTRCNNYFRAANGRVVTQWPRSARVFWGMTRRFKAADYTFDSPSSTQGRRSAATRRGESLEKRGRSSAGDARSVNRSQDRYVGVAADTCHRYSTQVGVVDRELRHEVE